MGNNVEVEVEYIGTAKLILASGHLFGFRMVIVYNISVVVGYGTLCNGLYMIDLMHSLSHFSSSASFVNVVVVFQV